MCGVDSIDEFNEHAAFARISFPGMPLQLRDCIGGEPMPHICSSM